MHGVQLCNMELMSLLPTYYMLFLTAILGLIMGSFLDVIVCRFHTGKSINGRSRCMSCGHTLSWYELFPLLSYVLLKGKCKSCDAFIPMRLLLMELTTAGLFMLVYLSSPSLLFLAFGLTLASFLVVIAAYDMRHMIIPNEFVVAVFLCASLYVGYEAYVASSLLSLIPHLIAGFGATLFYLTLWLVSKGRWIGLGDVKLAFPLGLMLLPLSAFSFVVFSFWIGAILSIALIVIQKILEKGKNQMSFLQIPITMKSEVPFAPFMLIAFVIVFFMQTDVLSIIAKLF